MKITKLTFDRVYSNTMTLRVYVTVGDINEDIKYSCKKQ